MRAGWLSPTSVQTWQGHVAAGMCAASLTIGMIAGGSLAMWGLAGGCIMFMLVCLTAAPAPDWRVIGFALALIALILAADLNALAPGRSWAMSGRVVSVLIPLVLLLHTTQIPLQWPRWFSIVPLMVCGVEITLLAEFLTRGGVIMPWLHGKNDNLVFYDRGLSYATVLVWPFIHYLLQERRPRMAALVWGGLAVVVSVSASRGAPLALAVGTGFAMLAWYRPRWVRSAAVAYLALMAFGILCMAPWVMAEHSDWLAHLPVSWHHRFEIWDYMIRWDSAAPWLGHGLDGAGVVPVQPPPQMAYLYATGPAAHPHHAALQLWLELGPLGWVWGVGLALSGVLAVRPWAPTIRACAYGAWAALITLAGGAFSLWTDSFMTLAIVTIFWLLISAKRLSFSQQPQN